MRSVSVHELKSSLDTTAAEDVLVLLDVREPDEFAEGHVPGAELVPLAMVPLRLGELPADRPVYLVCAVGGRSAQAAMFLTARGVDAVNVAGGTQEWVASGYPVQR
jgi:rhodanese-related sulfurtransferase